MDSLLLGAWRVNPPYFAERIVSFLLDYPSQRLNIGYDMSIGGADIFVAVSRTAVAAASPICSEGAFSKLESAIMSLVPHWELERRQVGRTRLALLRSLPEDRLTEATLRHIQELERRFPNAEDSAIPKTPEPEKAFQWADSPIPEEAQQYMSDEQWLSAMTKYTNESPDWHGEQLVGNALELSRDLEASVRKDPNRFSELASKMDNTLPAIYFEAILRGLTEPQEDSSPSGTIEQVSTTLRRAWGLGIPVDGAIIARAIGTLANEALPSDVVRMLCQIAIHDPDPSGDGWSDPETHAINSSRGAAAEALSQLLFADRSRWESLKPTIRQLVVDPVVAVRSVAVDSLLAVLDINRVEALNYFQKLADGADPILGTRRVERFINFALFRDYPAIRPTLIKMLESSSADTVRAGARMVTLAALWLEEARGDEDRVLSMGTEQRAGAAQIYAGYLSDETVGAECEKRLSTLFLDEKEVVRRKAGRCWSDIDPDQIPSRGRLIGVFARSLRPGDDVTLLAYRLKDSRRPLPVEVCDLAEHAIEAFGHRASSMQYEDAGAASELSTLMIRLHEETDSPNIRRRVLDIIDKMTRAGFYGIDKHLREQHER